MITTAPSVRYRVTTTSGEVMEVDNPTKFPDPSGIKQVEEPIFRSAGCGGVAYKSGLARGLNIALFDISAAEVVNCRLFRTKSVRYEFAEAATRYYIAKHYKNLRERFPGNAVLQAASKAMGIH